jgi:hypothetical protein
MAKYCLLYRQIFEKWESNEADNHKQELRHIFDFLENGSDAREPSILENEPPKEKLSVLDKNPTDQYTLTVFITYLRKEAQCLHRHTYHHDFSRGRVPAFRNQ